MSAAAHGLRLIDTGLGGARANIAMTAALAELHTAGRIPDTLRLHRYPLSVLLGRSQPLAPEVRAACARRGAEIARRVTGGGAVAMGQGALAWDLVLPRSAFPTLDAAAAAIGTALAGVLRGRGLAAAFRGPGDVLVAERKVAGTAGLHEGATLLHQGSLLVAGDVAEMADLLGVPDLPLTTLARHGGPGMAEAADLLAAALAAALGRPLAPATMGSAERVLAARLLAEEIGREDFVAGERAA